jgi:hypothetical protein
MEAPMVRIIKVQAQWDPEAEVWTGFSTNVPGIVTEAPTIEALRERLKLLVPDFLDAAGERADDLRIDIEAFVTDVVGAA